MKKFFAILLVLVLTLSLGVTAFAADGVEPAESGEKPAASAPSVKPADITLVKTYETTGFTPAEGSEDKAVYPVETLKFNVEAAKANQATDGTLTIADVTTTGEKDNNVVLVFPTYSKVGVYEYTISEEAGTTAGVTYDTTKYLVRVTVTNTQSGDGAANAFKADVAIHKINPETGEPSADKLDPKDPSGTAAFTNKYGVGTLEVTKKVSGKLASNTEAFDITVTFTNANASGTVKVTKPDGSTADLTFTDGKAELTVAIQNDATAKFENIPVGTTYTVVEDAKYQGPKVDGGTKETDEWCYDEPEYTFTNAQMDFAQVFLQYIF